MEATQLLTVLRRRAWSIVRFTVVIGAAVGIISFLRTPTYVAHAQVLLRPNDPGETLDPANSQPLNGLDAGRYANSQAAIAISPAVAAAAAPDVPGGLTAAQLLDHVSVSVDPNSNVLTINGKSIDPAQAKTIADAFANHYIENRRQFEVATLQKAIDDISTQLTLLQQQIARYDTEIANGATGAGATSTVTTPTAPVSPTPTRPSITQTPGVDPGAAPASSDQALVAARFAAATQYQTLYAQQQELNVDKSLKRGAAELVSDAKLPTTPSSPKPIRDGVLGAVAGLLIGIGVSFAREQLDDKVRNAEQLEELTGIPVLARVPLDDAVANNPDVIAVEARPLGQFAESIRALRTSLQFMGVDEPVRSVLVTSAVPGDGKTAIAVNLAVVCAQAGLRTVLVSADMRRPRLDAMFPEVELGNGLSGMLTQLAASRRRMVNGSDATPEATAALVESILSEHLVTTSIENLSVLPAGLRAPNPAEVLGSRWMREVMTHLAQTRDIVVIDSSPALAVTDAVVLSTLADGALLVVPTDGVSRRDVQRAIKTFESVDARLLGTVLNRSAEAGNQYYYGYEPTDAKPAFVRRTRRARRELVGSSSTR